MLYLLLWQEPLEEDKSSDVEVWEFESEEEAESSVSISATGGFSGSSKDPTLSGVVRQSVLDIINFICKFLLSWQAVFRITDNALNILFKFFGLLLFKLKAITGSRDVEALYQHFPTSLFLARKMQLENCNFFKFVVCPKCHSTYRYDDCIAKDGITKCTYVRFPRHPQKRMRVPCNISLLKSIKTSSEKRISLPLKVFCNQSLVQSIKQLVLQPGMLDLLNQWKARSISCGVMADIYDGSVWKSFLTVNGKEFLLSRYGFGLLINVDWFQPYKHVQCSVGAIYIAILNFPRHLRYRRENMILIGVIPGPHEPSLHINSFIEPLVKELLKLWKGIEMRTMEGTQVVRAVLLCNSSDIPETRKVGGFVGHGASKGCSRCLKSFACASFSDKPNYSGFNYSAWPKRSLEQHQIKGMDWKHAKTQVERHKIERESGFRFTELLRLSYFDSSRFSVIDPCIIFSWVLLNL